MIKSFKQSVVLYKRGKLWHLRPWGRHSLVLMVAGIVYVGIGISYMVAEHSPSREIALEYAFNWFPLHVWGMWWIATGVITMVSARWPPVDRIWGYELLTGLASAWGLFYLAGVVFGESPNGNFTSAAVWGLVAFMWWAISGLKDQDSSYGHV